jgi:hypothetical protein
MPIISNIPQSAFTAQEAPRNRLGQDVVSAFSGGLARRRKEKEAADAKAKLIDSVKVLMGRENRQFADSSPEDQQKFAESLITSVSGGVDPRTAPFLFPPDPNRSGSEAAGGGFDVDTLLGTDAAAKTAEPEESGPGIMSNIGSFLEDLIPVDGGGGDQVDPNLVIDENPLAEGSPSKKKAGGFLGRILKGLTPNTPEHSLPPLPRPDQARILPDHFNRGLEQASQGPVEGPDLDLPVGEFDAASRRQELVQPPQDIAQAQPVKRGRKFKTADGTILFVDLNTGNFVDENDVPILDKTGQPIQ